jgi:hypothetical protein
MENSQAMRGAEFGLNLLRLSRAVSEEPAGEEKRLSTVLKEARVHAPRAQSGDVPMR